MAQLERFTFLLFNSRQFHFDANSSPDNEKKTMTITNYSPPPDAIIYEFNPHILIAVICLLTAFMIVLTRVLIDHAGTKPKDPRVENETNQRPLLE
jgi:hypothetical protein